MPVEDAAALRRDRLIAVLSLLGLVLPSWIYLWTDAGRMDTMSRSMGAMGTMEGAAMAAQPTTAWPLALTFLMWSVMMVGMMLPSALPAILLYGSMVRKRRDARAVLPAIWVFAAGYLAVWTGFGLAATLLQVVMDRGGVLTPMMSTEIPWLTAGSLLVAGAYQWLPFKDACLRRCREPLHFFLFNWRPGALGGFRMGALHGMFCVGCCWALMLLLFAVGTMNLLWVALIAGFILVEKLLPSGRLIGRLAGAMLGVVGVGVIIAGT